MILMVTLIKNIILVDGSGRSPVKADVLIRDKKIVAVGSFPTYKADEVVNGNESYLVPGFIDPDITSDRYLTLFSSPYHKNFIAQGVTSGIIGQCGFSLAPNFYGHIWHCCTVRRDKYLVADTAKIDGPVKQLKNYSPDCSVDCRLCFGAYGHRRRFAQRAVFSGVWS